MGGTLQLCLMYVFPVSVRPSLYTERYTDHSLESMVEVFERYFLRPISCWNFNVLTLEFIVEPLTNIFVPTQYPNTNQCNFAKLVLSCDVFWTNPKILCTMYASAFLKLA
jgi:hypothetical protein